MKGQQSILFVLPVATQPRFSRRIQSYQRGGGEITVASFEREYFSKNSLPKNINYVSLGEIVNGSYFKRIPRILKSLKTLVNLSRNKDMIFLFSADVLIFLSPFVNERLIHYEIGDIREFSTNKTLNKAFELVYRRRLRKVNSIIVTSIGFKDFLMERYLVSGEKIVITENKLSKKYFKSFDDQHFRSLESQKFTIGIVGLLRYENILSFLRAYKKDSPEFNIVIFGDGPLQKKILPFVDRQKVKFFGQFKYPDDLEHIYASIDLSFTMYDSEDQNVRLALPNKLYESMYFKKPILVSKGTYLEKRVADAGIGFSWNQNDMEGLVKYLSSQRFKSDYNDLEKSFNNINESDCLL